MEARQERMSRKPEFKYRANGGNRDHLRERRKIKKQNNTVTDNLEGIRQAVLSTGLECYEKGN